VSRKKPIRHYVRPYNRQDGTHVSQHWRGVGSKTKKLKSPKVPDYLESKRWEQIADGSDYQWRSTENPSITVNVNKEEQDEEELEEEYGEDYNREELGYMYLVFPSYDHKGIPNSPEVFSEGTSGSFANAKRDAIDLAEKIMKLPIEKIERFDWEMVE
jgi:hypothetical protein